MAMDLLEGFSPPLSVSGFPIREDAPPTALTPKQIEEAQTVLRPKDVSPFEGTFESFGQENVLWKYQGIDSVDPAQHSYALRNIDTGQSQTIAVGIEPSVFERAVTRGDDEAINEYIASILGSFDRRQDVRPWPERVAAPGLRSVPWMVAGLPADIGSLATILASYGSLLPSEHAVKGAREITDALNPYGSEAQRKKGEQWLREVPKDSLFGRVLNILGTDLTPESHNTWEKALEYALEFGLAGTAEVKTAATAISGTGDAARALKRIVKGHKDAPESDALKTAVERWADQYRLWGIGPSGKFERIYRGAAVEEIPSLWWTVPISKHLSELGYGSGMGGIYGTTSETLSPWLAPDSPLAQELIAMGASFMGPLVMHKAYGVTRELPVVGGLIRYVADPLFNPSGLASRETMHGIDPDPTKARAVLLTVDNLLSAAVKNNDLGPFESLTLNTPYLAAYESNRLLRQAELDTLHLAAIQADLKHTGRDATPEEASEMARLQEIINKGTYESDSLAKYSRFLNSTLKRAYGENPATLNRELQGYFQTARRLATEFFNLTFEGGALGIDTIDFKGQRINQEGLDPGQVSQTLAEDYRRSLADHAVPKYEENRKRFAREGRFEPISAEFENEFLNKLDPEAQEQYRNLNDSREAEAQIIIKDLAKSQEGYYNQTLAAINGLLAERGIPNLNDGGLNHPNLPEHEREHIQRFIQESVFNQARVWRAFEGSAWNRIENYEDKVTQTELTFPEGSTGFDGKDIAGQTIEEVIAKRLVEGGERVFDTPGYVHGLVTNLIGADTVRAALRRQGEATEAGRQRNEQINVLETVEGEVKSASSSAAQARGQVNQAIDQVLGNDPPAGLASEGTLLGTIQRLLKTSLGDGTRDSTGLFGEFQPRVRETLKPSEAREAYWAQEDKIRTVLGSTSVKDLKNTQTRNPILSEEYGLTDMPLWRGPSPAYPDLDIWLKRLISERGLTPQQAKRIKDELYQTETAPDGTVSGQLSEKGQALLPENDFDKLFRILTNDGVLNAGRFDIDELAQLLIDAEVFDLSEMSDALKTLESTLKSGTPSKDAVKQLSALFDSEKGSYIKARTRIFQEDHELPLTSRAEFEEVLRDDTAEKTRDAVQDWLKFTNLEDPEVDFSTLTQTQARTRGEAFGLGEKYADYAKSAKEMFKKWNLSAEDGILRTNAIDPVSGRFIKLRILAKQGRSDEQGRVVDIPQDQAFWRPGTNVIAIDPIYPRRGVIRGEAKGVRDSDYDLNPWVSSLKDIEAANQYRQRLKEWENKVTTLNQRLEQVGNLRRDIFGGEVSLGPHGHFRVLDDAGNVIREGVSLKDVKEYLTRLNVARSDLRNAGKGEQAGLVGQVIKILEQMQSPDAFPGINPEQLAIAREASRAQNTVTNAAQSVIERHLPDGFVTPLSAVPSAFLGTNRGAVEAQLRQNNAALAPMPDFVEVTWRETADGGSEPQVTFPDVLDVSQLALDDSYPFFKHHTTGEIEVKTPFLDNPKAVTVIEAALIDQLALEHPTTQMSPTEVSLKNFRKKYQPVFNYLEEQGRNEFVGVFENLEEAHKAVIATNNAIKQKAYDEIIALSNDPSSPLKVSEEHAELLLKAMETKQQRALETRTFGESLGVDPGQAMTKLIDTLMSRKGYDSKQVVGQYISVTRDDPAALRGMQNAFLTALWDKSLTTSAKKRGLERVAADENIVVFDPDRTIEMLDSEGVRHAIREIFPENYESVLSGLDEMARAANAVIDPTKIVSDLPLSSAQIGAMTEVWGNLGRMAGLGVAANIGFINELMAAGVGARTGTKIAHGIGGNALRDLIIEAAHSTEAASVILAEVRKTPHEGFFWRTLGHAILDSVNVTKEVAKKLKKHPGATGEILTAPVSVEEEQREKYWDYLEQRAREKDRWIESLQREKYNTQSNVMQRSPSNASILSKVNLMQPLAQTPPAQGPVDPVQLFGAGDPVYGTLFAHDGGIVSLRKKPKQLVL